MSRVEELENEIKGLENRKLELLKQLELEKQNAEIEYPKMNMLESYWSIDFNGTICRTIWLKDGFDKQRSKIGNVFLTKEEAELERDKRALLTRFRQFRDKCNGDWKPDFKDDDSWKYYIIFNHQQNKMKVCSYLILEEFNLFGYFKNESDVERAIELFGDEIKRLFVEEEK